jgi:lysophospholipase L1-like esterase
MKLIMPPLYDVARRAVLLAGALAAASLALPISPVGAAEPRNWVGTWGAVPAGPPLPAQLLQFKDQTLRLIVHTSIGGTQVRIRLSNEFGSTPLRIGAAHVALRQAGATIVGGTDRKLTFGGLHSAIIPPGAPLLSDPVDLSVPALSDLAVSLHLPGPVPVTTLHWSTFNTNYVSAPGDHTGDVALPAERTIGSWPFLTAIDVLAPNLAASVVTFGDSITDGSLTKVDANHRWPDLLALRLQNKLGVVNKGNGGARLLRDPGEQPLFGRSALARFDRDVLATPGVHYMIVLVGINDIGHPGTGTIPLSELPAVDQMIAGYRQLIARAHEKGIAIFGGTLTPFGGTVFAGYYSPQKELLRQAVNKWIRTGGEFDGMIDFDKAVRDPRHPTRMLPTYDSGDHLHPNDNGMQAMANAIPLGLFREHGFSNVKASMRR